MHRFRIGLAVVALIGITPSASAQTVGRYKFKSGSPVSAFGYSVGTYKAQLDGKNVDVYCVDFLNHVGAGNQYNVYITSLAGHNPNLAKTRFGSWQGQLDRYKQAAWLASQIKPSNTNQWGYIQAAIWHLTTPVFPRLSNTQTTQVNNWMTLAQQNYRRFYYNNVYVLTDTVLDRCRANPAMSAPYNGCGHQEHITIDGGTLTVTPEPGSVALMATGLVAVAGAGAVRRRRKGQQA